MQTTARLLFAAVAASAALPAQCPFQTVTTQSLAPGCNFASTGLCAIVALPTTLTTTLDTTNCRLDISVNAFEGCGATVPLRALVFGTQQVFVPLPEFGATCALHVAPIAMLATASGPFSLNLPPGLSSLSFLVQGAALSVPPFAIGNILTLSDAQSIDLQ
ncbi:MAG TPA: hypothetical protein VFZ65_20915 [Planctomycetota bacterium]|nr:hypothetical protein [Planctomycetota bacterium]